MHRFHMSSVLCISFIGISILGGCSSSERAIVSFSYAVEPSRGLPQGMNAIYIQPVKNLGETEKQWSNICATTLRRLVQESISDYGTNIELADRENTEITFEEADLAAAGMSTGRAGAGGKVLAVQGAIFTSVNIKKTIDVGKQRTLSGLDIARFGNRHWRGGRTNIRTEEVDTVSRHLTVQMDFKLLDTANKQWASHSPTYSASDRTKAGIIFASSQTEAALTPTDQIIAGLVEKCSREFISKLMKCRISVREEITASRNENCVRGVKMLRAEAYEEAISFFKVALAENPEDDRAAFGAGLAAEASGNYHDALRFYKRACAEKLDEKYTLARDRMKAYADRT